MKGKANGKRRGAKNRREDSRGKGPSDRNTSEEREFRSDGGRNDISWYSRNPNLLVAAGSFPYPYRPGMSLPMGSLIDPTGTTGKAVRGVTIPGVMVLDWIPSIGISSKATDPASILGKEIYSRVRKVYSGDLAADGPDYVMYILSLSSLFSYIAWLKRLYRLLVVWTPDNYILPDAVIGAMGFTEADITALRVERTALWQAINELILQSRKFTCPASIDLINRHYWMSDNVYTDEQTINSQFYLFNLVGVYKFQMLKMADGNPGPGCRMVATPNNDATHDLMSVKKLYDFGLSLVNALSEWDGAYVINGYLRRAFEGESMFIVDELPLDQPFSPVYVPEVLTQIENSRPLFGFQTSALIAMGSLLDITQDVATNSVISNPSYKVTDRVLEYSLAQAQTIPPVLSIRSDMPTVADSVIASRLQATVEWISDSGTAPNINHKLLIHAGTEIPLGWRLFNGFHDPAMANVPLNDRALIIGNTELTMFPIINAISGSTLPISTVSWISRSMQVEQFDWHPFMYFTWIGKNADDTPSVYFSVMGDTHNITVISQADLDNLHKICIYSEMNSFSF